jgi:hypothetical protein
MIDPRLQHDAQRAAAGLEHVNGSRAAGDGDQVITRVMQRDPDVALRRAPATPREQWSGSLRRSRGWTTTIRVRWTEALLSRTRSTCAPGGRWVHGLRAIQDTVIVEILTAASWPKRRKSDSSHPGAAPAQRRGARGAPVLASVTKLTYFTAEADA